MRSSAGDSFAAAVHSSSAAGSRARATLSHPDATLSDDEADGTVRHIETRESVSASLRAALTTPEAARETCVFSIFIAALTVARAPVTPPCVDGFSSIVTTHDVAPSASPSGALSSWNSPARRADNFGGCLHSHNHRGNGERRLACPQVDICRRIRRRWVHATQAQHSREHVIGHCATLFYQRPPDRSLGGAYGRHEAGDVRDRTFAHAHAYTSVRRRRQPHVGGRRQRG
eukprot:4178972-Prymnesium_polylepis.1